MVAATNQRRDFSRWFISRFFSLLWSRYDSAQHLTAKFVPLS